MFVLLICVCILNITTILLGFLSVVLGLCESCKALTAPSPVFYHCNSRFVIPRILFAPHVSRLITVGGINGAHYKPGLPITAQRESTEERDKEIQCS